MPEVGDADTVFLDRKLNVLARGYERIVYGDHGPYLELTASQIHWPSFPKSAGKLVRWKEVLAPQAHGQCSALTGTTCICFYSPLD